MMQHLGRVRRIRFYPQVQWPAAGSASFLPPVIADQKIINSPQEHALVSDVSDLRKRLDYRFWSALCAKDWLRWEAVAQMYHSHNLPMDEVSLSLLAHGYLLSHHHPASTALLVLERMKRDNIHPAVVKLNEGLLNSFFQLSDLGIRSSQNGWQNLVRLVWMSAARVRNKRRSRVKTTLQSLPTRDVLRMEESDIAALIEEEHAMGKVVCERARETERIGSS